MIDFHNEKLLRATLTHLRARGGRTLFLAGPCKNAKKVLRNPNISVSEILIRKLEIAPNFTITGARLSEMTQAMLYKGIMKYERQLKQTKYEKDLETIRERVRVILPTDKLIWGSLRNKDITKKIRAFMWSAMHDGQKIGDYWLNKQNLEYRGKCRACDTTETLEHILTECRCSGQEIAWKLAEGIIKKKSPTWKRPNLGQMLGQGYINESKKKKSKEERGKRRLQTIISTETMHLIWKLRCEWKIGRNEDMENQITKQETINKWHSVINSRLKIDCLLTNRKKYGSKALKRGMVMDTWSGTLTNEGEMVEDWARPGVLVGIKPVTA
ncbi:hypothetical protein BJ165DRAFT_1342952 [Panaeolus papilionaceus]|nr:hypothetical protein BJ165DRAFT_1342952 [Panaeolus papilionaceus]